MSDALDTELAVLVDAGSAWAKAGVIGRVRGAWRLVAHAAQPTVWGPDELRHALAEQLESSGDPRLGGRFERLLRGVSRIECHSAPRQARLAIVAVSRELSGGAARRAAEAAGWEVAPFVTLDDGRTLADRLAALGAAQVDAWLAVGGFDGASSPRALEAAALVAAARLPGTAPVVWAGSRQLADGVLALFPDGEAEAAPNPRPDARAEQADGLREHLEALLRRVGGSDPDESHLATTTLPRAVGALAEASGLTVLAVDLGARTAARAWATPDGGVTTRVSANGGLGPIATVAGAAARVARLAGDAGDEAAVADVLRTMRARPATLPQRPEELSALQAAARIQLAALMDDAPAGAVDVVVGCGRTIAAAPRPGQAARMLLDGVRPVGVTQLAVDAAAVLGPLGSLSDEEMREGLSLLAPDALAPLGTAIVTRGGDPGQVAMRVVVHRPGWPTPAPVVVRAGQLVVVPLARGAEAELSIELGSGVSLGAARRSPRIGATVTGGAVGLILDARGAPIPLPRRAEDRRAVLAGWAEALEREERVA